MSKRGRVLRDPYAGPGLLMVEGQQYSFGLEGLWKSEVPAKPGLVVDVDFDHDRKIIGITAVPESQLAKEQAALALEAAKARGGNLFGQVVATVGAPGLVAAGVLFLSWTWLTAIAIQLPYGRMQFTFWQLLGYLNSENVAGAMERNIHPSAGIYGLLALICVVAPFLHCVWKDKRAVLAGFLPLVFMIIVGVMARNTMTNAIGGAGNPYGEMRKQVQDELTKAISYGMGIYLSALASVYFAGTAARNYLAAKATEIDVMPRSHKAAA